MGVVLAARRRDCYIRTAVSYRNEGVINQPAEPQQHSGAHQLIFFHSVLHFSSPLIYVILRHDCMGGGSGGDGGPAASDDL